MRRRAISAILALSALLAACGPSQVELDALVATSISETKSASPTDTPIPTEARFYEVELQIESSLVNALTMDIWTIEWGAGGSQSSYEYGYSDLSAHGFTGPGFRVHWSKKLQAKPGDSITLSITGEYDASCIIIVAGQKVVSSTLSGGGRAQCQYEVP